MLMRSQEPNAVHRRHRESGFSLLEMVVVLAISIIVSVVSVISLIPLLNQQHVTNAYNTTLAAMRLARDTSVAQRASYSVTFSNSVTPNTITVAPTVAGFQGDQNTVVYQLPSDVSFLAQTGLPTAATAVPDGYGSGTIPIDFGWTINGVGTGGATTIYFCPDGSSQRAPGTNNDGSCPGTWDGGVLYLARTGDLMSSRAITLWGGTGRIHGWRLYGKSGGGYQWLRQ